MKQNRLIALLIIFAISIQILPNRFIRLSGPIVAQSGKQLTQLKWAETVRPDKDWVLTFNSPVDVLTINRDHVKVFDAAGQEVPVWLRTSLDGLSVTIRPQADYKPGEYVLKTLDGIEDTLGREQPQDVEIRFTVDGEPEPDDMVIKPAQINLQPGQSTRFTADLVGGKSTKPFIWSVTGSAGSGEFIGRITSDGTYQAPVRPGQYVINVKSEEFPNLNDTAVVIVNEPPAVDVDLALDATSLNRLPTSTQPGSSIVLVARVFNRSAAGKRIGGSIARFFMNDRIIDEVPFYINAGQAYQDVRAYYVMPMGECAVMRDKEEFLAKVTVEVDPYNEILETQENNNSVSSTIPVRYREDITIRDTNPQLSIDATGLSVWSIKDDALGNRVNAAQPGQRLRLKVKVNYLGEDASEDINIKFLVNGIVVLNDNRRPNKPSAGFFEVSCDYQVPFICTDPIDFRVLLSNGSTAGLSIPVLQHDLGVGAGDLYWSSDIVAKPGQHLYLHAILSNMSSISFPTDNDRVSWRALIDGKEFAEGDFSVGDNLTNVTLPAFDVPVDQTKPILLTFFTDVYDQIKEANENNNFASIEIPVLNTGLVTPNFYINSSDLSYIANPIIPGSNVMLSAAVHSQGAGFPQQSLQVQFKINGNVVGTKTVDHNLLRPLQAEKVTFEWVAPLNLPDRPVYQVVLDPDSLITENNESDNSASMEMTVAKPDLDVTDSSISCQPVQPNTGTTVKVTAIVENNGSAPAIGAKVRFFADGQAIGDAVIDQIPGSSAANAVLDWAIPATPAPDLPFKTLAGRSGKIPVPSNMTRQYQLTVQADPTNLIKEINETNNASSAVSMTATIPTLRRFVFVQTVDILGNVSSATTTLTAVNGESATVDTGEDGWCSFTGVPAGNYTIRIVKEGYESVTYPAKTQDSYPAQYRTFDLKRTKDFVGMTGKDSDQDLIADADEPFYGTDPTIADSDGDGVIDGKDLSPLTNPTNPVPEYLQKVGMVRFDQAIAMHGLDGWVEVYDMDLDILALSDDLEYSYTDYNNGTRSSTMDVSNFRKAIDKAFSTEKFKTYAIKDISALEAGADPRFPELGRDLKADDRYDFTADHTHRTEYRFNYDYLVDYQLASLKNTEEIFYPNKDQFFSYLLMPVKVMPGLQHTFTFQFTQSGLADKIFNEGDSYYNELGFEYTFYETNVFDHESTTLAPTYVSLADCDGSDLFQFSISLTPAQAMRSDFYLKITPVWVHQENGTTTMSPVNLNWDLSGLTREVDYSVNANGSRTIRESLASIDGFNTAVKSYVAAMNLFINPNTQKTPQSNPQERQVTATTLVVDPSAPAEQRYQATQMQLRILNYVGAGVKGMKETISASETFNIIRYNAKSLDNLPADSIFRTAAYSNVTTGLDTATSLISIYTNGTQAWKAYQDGDRILCAYYSIKTGAAVGQTAGSLAKISLNVVATTSKTGRIARLASKEVATGISIAIGVLEIAYYISKYNSTKDPIQKVGFAEKTCAAEIDLGLAIVMAVYPPLVAFQLTWLIVHEGYGFIFGRDKMAYSLTTSFGTVGTFIISIWTEQIPSQFAEKAYGNVVKVLFERFNVINAKNYPYVPVFVDPLQ